MDYVMRLEEVGRQKELFKDCSSIALAVFAVFLDRLKKMATAVVLQHKMEVRGALIDGQHFRYVFAGVQSYMGPNLLPYCFEADLAKFQDLRFDDRFHSVLLALILALRLDEIDQSEGASSEQLHEVELLRDIVINAEFP